MAWEDGSNERRQTLITYSSKCLPCVCRRPEDGTWLRLAKSKAVDVIVLSFGRKLPKNASVDAHCTLHLCPRKTACIIGHKILVHRTRSKFERQS